MILCSKVLYHVALAAYLTCKASANTPLKLRPKACPPSAPIPIQAPKGNIWAQLNQVEASSVYHYLTSLPEHNFVTPPNASLYSNYINDVELWKPSKAEALRYLDEDGHTPARYAKATVVFGAPSEPYVENWLVGPLPIGDWTTIRPMDEFFTRNRLPWHAKPFLKADILAQQDFARRAFEPLNAAFQDLFGGNLTSGFTDAGEGGVTPAGGPRFDGTKRTVWTWLQVSGGVPDTAPFLYPLPIYTLLDFTGQDPEKWAVSKIVYNDVVYRSVEEFVRAWTTGSLTKLPIQDFNNAEWALRTPQGPRRKFDDIHGPISVQFDGPRFEVDEAQKYVDYQGWTFYLSYDWATGVRLFDIRFKGERIIYELGLEDALANYGGKDPAQQATAYLDRYYGIGSSGVPLARGYDCPHNAIFWNATFSYAGDFIETPQAICIFEQDAGFPISRHTASTSASTTKTYMLNVRYIAVVGNYDYLFSYLFYPDGTIETQVMASGYIQATYWTGHGDEEYGTRLGPLVMGALHDHVINFKVDFDIAGTRNSFRVDTIEIEEKVFPWSDGLKVRQKHLVTKTLQSEDEGKIDLAPNGVSHYRVVNSDAPNKWGKTLDLSVILGTPKGISALAEFIKCTGAFTKTGTNPQEPEDARGYRLQPFSGIGRITDPEDPKHGQNAAWSKQDISVIRRHDTEPSSSGTLNQNLAIGPQVDFDTFFNGESLVQEDLVVYYNLVMHHVPRAEDLPTTLFVGARASMMFSPFNWLGEEASRDLRQSFYAKPNKDQTQWIIDDHGVRPNTCMPGTFIPLRLAMVSAKAKELIPGYGQLGMGKPGGM